MGKFRVGTTALAVGAGLAYVFDQQNGARRRALLRDKYTHYRKVLGSKGLRDAHYLGNRARGLLAEVKSSWRETGPVDDDVVVERVRSKLGRVSAHAHAVEVYPKGKGVIELKGPISSAEHAKVIGALRAVRGVRGIDDDLVDHDPRDVIARHG